MKRPGSGDGHRAEHHRRYDDAVHDEDRRPGSTVHTQFAVQLVACHVCLLRSEVAGESVANGTDTSQIIKKNHRAMIKSQKSYATGEWQLDRNSMDAAQIA